MPLAVFVLSFLVSWFRIADQEGAAVLDKWLAVAHLLCAIV